MCADVTIDLDVVKVTSTNPLPAGYHASENNSGYGYKYSGGNDPDNGPGAFCFDHGTGSHTVQIQFGSGTSGYSFNSVSFSGDASHDIQQSTTSALVSITDSSVDIENGHFDVYVTDDGSSTTFQCDPNWRNK